MKKKVFNESVDQRQQKLPPTWIPNPSEELYHYDYESEFVLSSGPERHIAENLIELVNQANSMVALCSFFLADSELQYALEQAINRGVRVYILMSAETRLDNDAEDEFSQICLNSQKKMLSKLGGKVFVRSAPHFHAKFLIIDPYSESRKGILSTANFTKEAFERNEELAIILNKDECSELVKYFRYMLWEESEHELLDSNNFKPIKPLNELEFPQRMSDKIMLTSAKECSLLKTCKKLISEANEEITISSFGWDEKHEIVELLCKQAQAGIKVTVLARQRLSSMPALVKLAQAGAKVYGFKWLHAKVLITDKSKAIVMSANIQKHGLDQGFEAGVFVTDSRVQDLEAVIENWLRKDNYSLLPSPSLGDLSGNVTVWENKNFKEITINESKGQVLSELPAESAENLEIDHPDFKTNVDWRKSPCHTIEYSWTVKAPIKPEAAQEIFKNSKEIKKDKNLTAISFEPRIFQVNKKKVVVINSEEELPDAIRLKQSQKCSAVYYEA